MFCRALEPEALQEGAEVGGVKVQWGVCPWAACLVWAK